MSVYARFADFLEESLKLPPVIKMLHKMNWNQEFQFQIGEEMFCLTLTDGKLNWREGISRQADFMDATRVYCEEEVFAKILQGAQDSVDAQYVEEALKFLPSGKYTQIAFFHQLIRWGQQEIWRRKKEELAAG